MDIFSLQHITGLIIGASTFLIIGLFHPLVIKGEYQFGTKIWWVFLIVGVIMLFISILCKNIILQSILAVIAFSSFWSIHEVFEQKKRVEKGWFPKKPGKK